MKTNSLVIKLAIAAAAAALLSGVAHAARKGTPENPVPAPTTPPVTTPPVTQPGGVTSQP